MNKKPTSQRKYKIVLLSMFLITAGFVSTALSDKLEDAYSMFVTALLGAAGLYGSMNVGNKWVLAKNGVLEKSQLEDKDSDKEA